MQVAWNRLASKLALARALAKWHYSTETRRLLFMLMESLLTLPESLNDQFLQTLEVEEPDMMDQMNSYERYLFRKERASGIAEGRATGLIEGRAVGLAEGKMVGAAGILQSLMEQKFGVLPDWVGTRLSRADTEVLKQWGINLLNAQHLEDVFRE